MEQIRTPSPAILQFKGNIDGQPKQTVLQNIWYYVAWDVKIEVVSQRVLFLCVLCLILKQ